MKNSKLFSQIFPTYIILVLVILLIFAGYEIHILNNFYLTEVRSDLKARARLIAWQLTKAQTIPGAKLDSMLKALSASGGVRITFIRKDGKVLSDSHKDAAKMDNHGDRPEVRQALRGSVGQSIRYSYTLKKELVYLAIPIQKAKAIRAVLRVAFPLSAYNHVLDKLKGRFLVDGFTIFLLAVLFSYFISRRISKPLEEIKSGAERFAAGQFGLPLPETGSSEIKSLAKTLNTMASEIDKRIKTISHQRNEQEAMLSSMQEGVLAVTDEEQILRINRAAMRFLSVEEKNPEKRLTYEVIRQSDVLNFIRIALNHKKHVEKEITLLDYTPRYFHLTGDPLLDGENRIIGVLIVLNDITRQKQLDKMRHEFVANVSHELKTPITSIKGYVETLREGAVEDVETRDRFLYIIARQSDRMNAIIDDLLQLSKIEQRYGKLSVDLTETSLLPVLRSAILIYQQKADDKNISIEVDCSPQLIAAINPPLLEQALANLLDNAIKYSPSGSEIRISAQAVEQQIRLSVQDHGCGIEQQYHERLFERFFRVDKGRSREMGGTGLGLAIVKHIALAHQGRVYVSSTPGEGSTFTLEWHQ